MDIYLKGTWTGKMMNCLFATDLHGDISRYEKLLDRIQKEGPGAVFLGGDLLPFGRGVKSSYLDFVEECLAPKFLNLKKCMGDQYPSVFVVLGNDDPRIEEQKILNHADSGLWSYVHQRIQMLGSYSILGLSVIPPSPFLLKDWERYDVSRFVDPGCVSPEDGRRSVEVPAREMRYRTIQKDLEEMTGDRDLSRSVCLFHSPPYKTALDRAGLDGQTVDYVPVDVHVGSIAIRRFIEKRQPLLTLHGHVHESTRITGNWRDRIGHTHMFNAAHDGPELALIRFNLEDLESAERELV